MECSEFWIDLIKAVVLLISVIFGMWVIYKSYKGN